jgi:glycosyltransferase involved in cell wall biosynthesis
MPTFNGQQFLRLAIESALAQDIGIHELIVVDDGSTDETTGIVGEFAAVDTRVHLHVNDKRLGMAGNWNRSASLATGTWVKFLFQDDLLDPACVRTMLKAAEPAGQSFVACRRNFLFEDSISAAFRDDFLESARATDISRHSKIQGAITASDFLAIALRAPLVNCIGEPTAVMFRRELLSRSGYFDPALRQLTDWDMWLRMAGVAGLAYVDAPLATFRLHNRSATLHNRSPENRTDALDPLVLLHKMTTSVQFAPLRTAAMRVAPRLHLDDDFADEYLRISHLCRTDPHGPLPKLWAAAAGFYPALAPRQPRDTLRLLAARLRWRLRPSH